ncbi:MAG TPA: hypothetical protein VF981_05830 [Gemmatimonadaceae bacterium]
MISSDALGQVDDFSSGKGSSRDGSRGVTVVLGSLGLSVVGSLITRGHIDRSIATFNALQRQSAPDHGAVARHQPAASVVRSFAQPTWTANHGAGLRLGVAVIAR